MQIGSSLYGSFIDFPVRVDATGTFVTTKVPDRILAQEIADVIGTLRGEHVMLPNYGISDWVFGTVDKTFIPRISHEIEKQVMAYVPNLEKVRIKGGTDENGGPALHVTYWKKGEINSPGNLVYPIWQLREGV